MSLALEHKVIHFITDNTHRESALGALRYEALRKLNPRQFTELHKRNLAGENFDGMIDELIEKNT